MIVNINFPSSNLLLHVIYNILTYLRRSTMDLATMKVLSIHLPALLPPTSEELNVSHNAQVAAILGVGLVYQGTGHGHTAEVLLAEIGLYIL